MSDDRLFHRKLGHSQKVNALSADEELVWRTYVQEADDFGVLLFTPVEIQRGHERFGRRPKRVVQGYLNRVRDVGLIQVFEHQGRIYAYQRDWQDYQKVRYPHAAIHPRIPAVHLGGCSLATQWLHTVWPGARRDCKLTNWRPPKDWHPPSWDDGQTGHGSITVPQPFHDGSITVPQPFHDGSITVPQPFHDGSTSVPEYARARTRSTHRVLDLELERGGVGGNGSDRDEPDDRSQRAAWFVERYAELFAEYRRGARYVGRPALDFQEALTLVDVWENTRLEELVIAFLTTDNEFCRNGSGTIAQFRSRASWCDTKLKEAGI